MGALCRRPARSGAGPPILNPGPADHRQEVATILTLLWGRTPAVAMCAPLILLFIRAFLDSSRRRAIDSISRFSDEKDGRTGKADVIGRPFTAVCCPKSGANVRFPPDPHLLDRQSAVYVPAPLAQRLAPVRACFGIAQDDEPTSDPRSRLHGDPPPPSPPNGRATVSSRDKARRCCRSSQLPHGQARLG